MSDTEINDRLSLKAVPFGLCPDSKLALLALDGEVIPGQCSIHIGDANKFGVRYVTVIFEIVDAIGEPT